MMNKDTDRLEALLTRASRLCSLGRAMGYAVEGVEFCVFSPPSGPLQVHTACSGPLCLFGPGGSYLTTYTPKVKRSLWQWLRSRQDG